MLKEFDLLMNFLFKPFEKLILIFSPLLTISLSFTFREYVKEWRDKGISVVLWTVNSPVEKRYSTEVLKCPIMTDSVKWDSEQTATLGS